MRVFIWFLESPDSKDIKIAMEKVHFPSTWFNPSFGVFWGRWWPLKRLIWQKPLRLGLAWLKRTPSTTNGWISRFSRVWHRTSFKKKLLLRAILISAAIKWIPEYYLRGRGDLFLLVPYYEFIKMSICTLLDNLFQRSEKQTTQKLMTIYSRK